MRDSFRMLHPDEPEAGTFNNFGKPGGTRDKIDYIFVPGDTVVKEAGIDRRRPGGRYPSDHFAVWARVDVPIHPN
jgi:endonuclease/exonuclease/phosphatase family metal-dependent hydrolase